ncbi:DNA topoisomerase 3-alpha [Cardamine amara subsp. amara]|uniref:DNA topoisomerase n=1 Tax=Cardamine amara subsp. amara TaxID=228776 RepID=A0ABD1AUP3_CARAN
MQRTISLVAAKSSSSTSVLSLRPLMAKLQCRAIQNFPASSSSSLVRVDKVYRNVSQLQFKRESASCFKLACALPSHLRLLGSMSYAAPWSSSISRSFGNSFRPFTRRCFSQVPNTGNKNSIVGGDEKAGGNKLGFKKFNKKWKKHKVLASTKAEVVASTEPVIGDVSSGIKVELSTTASPATNGKQVSTVKTKRRPKSKKVEDKSSTVSVLEAVSVEESLISVPKPKHSGSGNRMSSSAEKEVAKNPTLEGPKSSTPSKSKSEQQHLKSTKANNAPKQDQAGKPAGKCSSQVPNSGNKDSIVGGDEKVGGNKSGFKKFNKNWKKHNVLASSEAEVGTSTEPVIGDVSSGIKVESTAVSPASNDKQASTVKTKRRPKSKKVEDKSSSAVPVLEAASLEDSSISVPKLKYSGSRNRKSSSAKYSSQEELAKNPTVEEPKSPAPSNSKLGKQQLKSAKASNSSKQKQVPQHMKNSIEHRGQNASKPLYPPSGKSVIVVESLTKAKIIQGYLGDMYEVLPSYGHIRDLASRSGSVRPDDDFSMVWEVPSSAWTHIKSIKVALNGAENLILASDPDREGEAIAWHIIEMLQQQGALHESMTVARVVFHEITESAIKSALQSPREIDGDLVHAYLARRALDYLIGFNISPLLWRKLPGCPSAGRVQSAALALICDRESEIDGFKPQEYWTVGIKVQGKDNSATFSAHLTSLNSKRLNQLSISSEAMAQDIEQRIRSEAFLVKSTKKSITRKNPPTPYITSTLQQDAANKLHFSTAHTMKLAQKLYEGVQLSGGKSAGLITYMRTDGLHIADEAIKDIQSLVAERYGKNFTSGSPRKYFKKVKNAQEAHEAIRPTDIRRLPSMIASLLDADSLKLYTLIWSRAVACQMEPASIGQIQLDFGNASESIIFRSSCSKVEFLGYQAVYEDPEAKAIKNRDDNQSSEREETFETLSSLKDGDLLHIGEVELKQHHTQHTPRYSEGSLIKKLEELGIGRPSTYASIFRVLQDRKYVTIKSRVLYPEFRGRMVSAFLTNYFTEVTDYSFTADMETELDNVSGGVTEWKGLLRDYWTRFSAYCKRVENVQRQQVEKMLEKKYEDFLFSSLPDPSRTCPSCMEGTLSFKVSKFGTGYFIGCDQYPSCKFVAKTLYGEDEDEDDPPKNNCVEEPKLLGLHPNTSEKVILKCGPYGHYVQLGEDKKGHVPKRANAAHIKDVNSITLKGALELLRYPLTLGTHPEDGQPVLLKLSKSGFTVRHRRTMATVPKNIEPGEVTFEKAMKLLSGKNVRLCGRPKRVQPTVDEEEEGDEEVAEAM